MEKLIAVILTVFVSVGVTGATPYMRLADPAHLHQSAAVLIDPNGTAPTVGVTDIAILTHSTADGSIIPKSWQTYCPPENWAPLEIGAGGSTRIVGGRLTGNAVVHIGSSINVAPQIGALILGGVNNTSPVVYQAIKAAMLNTGGNGVRIGGGFVGDVISGGIFQSVKEAFPGQGPADIAKKAARVTVGYSWVW